MRIESYFRNIQDVVDNCAVILLKDITFEKRGTYAGYIRGRLYFHDHTVLHLREFVDTQISIERLMYTYHYVDHDEKIIFRYDNTGHHKNLNLSSYPHHKHAGSESNIILSTAPVLKDVLQEIELLMDIFNKE